MAHTYAGRFYDAILNQQGQLLKSTVVSVYSDAGGTTAASLYTDATKASQFFGIASTDVDGMLEIFAEPGTYWIRAAGSDLREIEIKEDIRDTEDVFPSSDVNFNNHKGINAADPTENQDIATKHYIDQQIATTSVIGSDEWLIENMLAEAFLFTDAPTYDSTFTTTIVGVSFKWTDATPGIYTATLDSNGYPVAQTATYVGTTTKTVTVTIPRDGTSRISGTVTAVVS